jgi:uncharacterized membrane protein YfcA
LDATWTQETTWMALGIGALSAFTFGLSKTGIPGLGILAVVLFANVFPARVSTGIVLPLLICGDVVAVLTYHYHAVWRHLWPLFPWAVLGVLAGWLALGRLDDAAVAHLIGGIILVMALIQLRRAAAARANGVENGTGEEVASRPVFAAFAGTLAGFTTLIANAAGPIMILYLLAMRLPKMQFIGTAAWYYLLLNLFKVPFMVDLGLINTDSLAVTLKLAPFVVLGGLAGRVVIKRINQRAFELTALLLSLAAAVRLLLQN